MVDRSGVTIVIVCFRLDRVTQHVFRLERSASARACPLVFHRTTRTLLAECISPRLLLRLLLRSALYRALGRQIRFTVVAFVAGANPDEVPPVYGVVGSPTMHEGRRQYPVTYTPLVGGER